MARYFGTDGVRGRFGGPLMNESFAFKMGKALGQFLEDRYPHEALTVVVGRDTRESGNALSEALTAGLNQSNVAVRHAGVVPTPAVAMATVARSAHFGVVITASHNPAGDNGIKVFDGHGHKIDPGTENRLETLIDSYEPPEASLPSARFSTIDAESLYIDAMRPLMDEGCLQGWSLVLDTANGATARTSPAVLRHWGASLHLIGSSPDGRNINSDVGSEHPEKLARAVIRQEAMLGIAHDGDGDRMVLCDEKGAVVEGDVILGLLGCYAKRAGALSADTLVATVHSNLGLDRALADVGARVERVGVGDRLVAEKMRALGANIGGESSGHIIFSDQATTGDGLLAAGKLIGLMRQTGKALSELRKEVVLFPQATGNLMVRAKRPLAECRQLADARAELTSALGGAGRILIRYSGTEPKLRILVEADEQKKAREVLRQLERAARADLEVIGG